MLDKPREQPFCLSTSRRRTRTVRGSRSTLLVPSRGRAHGGHRAPDKAVVTSRRASAGIGARAIHIAASFIAPESRCERVDGLWGQRHFIGADPNGVQLDVIELIPPTPAYAASFTQPPAVVATA